MRILLTESTPGAAKRAEEMFRAAGYDIAFCHPEHGPGNDCVVFRGASHCPLRTSEIDVVVDVRAADGPQTARELGATCAVRAQRRLVVAGPADPATFPWSEAAALCPAD
ncbi:MAG: hypothetical protein HOW97_43705, partial [Catenulispora sp.]|nr:hypothetical protein [Catenulispora sp.]